MPSNLDLIAETPPLPPPLPGLGVHSGHGSQAPLPPFITHSPTLYAPISETARPLPPKPSQNQPPPSQPPSSSPWTIAASATISAEPEMRDLRKESTAFVPSALKRKKPASAKVDSRPDVESSELKVAPAQERPDLLKTLQSRLSQAGNKR